MHHSSHHSFDINVASEYGIEEAILIHHFQHWIRINKAQKKNLHEGRYWSYQTLDEIAACFPYFTKSKVFDLLEKLCIGKGRQSKKEELDFDPVLIKGNFNKSSYDRTIWYAFVEEPKWILGFPNMDIGKSQNQDCEIPKSIDTDTKPDAKTNTKPPPTSSTGGGGDFISSLVGDWTYKNVKGEAVSLTQSQIFKHFVRLSFTTEILQQAIKEAIGSNELIGNPWKYLEAICFRLTQETKKEAPKDHTKQDLPPKNTKPKVNFMETWKNMTKKEKENGN